MNRDHHKQWMYQVESLPLIEVTAGRERGRGRGRETGGERGRIEGEREEGGKERGGRDHEKRERNKREREGGREGRKEGGEGEKTLTLLKYHSFDSYSIHKNDK